MNAKPPTSKAKTAYGLLSEIRALILAEPKRYNQHAYLANRGCASDAPRGAPSCGTVGCVAGWVATLKGPEHIRYDDVHRAAAEILHLSFVQAECLFDGSAIHHTKAPQTSAHARAGASHIHRFQKQYAAQLKATKV